MKRLKLSEQVRAAILTSGLSQSQIVQESGVDAATLSRFIKDKRGLTLAKLDAIADVLRLNLATTRPRSLDDE